MSDARLAVRSLLQAAAEVKKLWSPADLLPDLMAMLGVCLGAAAIVLAALGIYGVTAYAVARRRGETGIRIALGAVPAGVVRLVLAHVSRLVGAGVAIGSLASSWAATFLGSLIDGIQPRDGITFAAAIAVLSTVGLAGMAGARRASRLDQSRRFAKAE